MHKIRFILASGIVGSLSLASAVSAQTNLPDVTLETPLSETELFNVFEGQTHRGSYNFMRKNIKTFSFEETTSRDGSIFHVQGPRVDTGEWLIEGSEICYHYDADDITPACFEIYQRGNCYYHYQKSVRGINRTGFTARTIIKGEDPDCAPLIS